MLQRKPKNHTIIDMYKAWFALTLSSNSNYFDEHDVQIARKGIRIIYERTTVSTPVIREVLSGELNGVNHAYQTVNKHWVKNSVKVYKNGVLLSDEPYSSNRAYYLIAGKHTVIMLEPPKPTDIISISYEYYNHPMIMSYTMFRVIVESHNKYASEALIQGNRFDLHPDLGYLFPARIERYYNASKVDVVATVNARRKQPGHPAIYFTSPDYCMIKWHKMYKIKNESVYSFVTAKQTMRKEFYIANKNPLLRTIYKFYPVQRQQTA